MKTLLTLKQSTLVFLLSLSWMPLFSQVPEMVKDIFPGADHSIPSFMAEINDAVLIVAEDSNGKELWKTDGTAAGTVLIKDINPGTGSSSPFFIAALNGVVFFRATDPVNGTELWKTDGTTAGTVLVKDIYSGTASSDPSFIASLNGILIFKAKDLFNQTEIWKTDGTTAGTVLLKDIFNTWIGGSSNPYPIATINGVALFGATTLSNGTELWKTDGTTAGTVLVKDIFAGAFDSSPTFLQELNGAIIFSAEDATNGTELWKTDGTTAGTVLVKDINPGSVSSSPALLSELNGILYLRATNAAVGTELWKTDGTASGTVLVNDINPGNNSSEPYFIGIFNEFIFFEASEPTHGRELWYTDGISTGVADLEPGVGSSYPGAMGNVNGSLIFSANTFYPGGEPWVVDNTSGSISWLKDIHPGVASSYPYFLMNGKEKMFFSAINYENDYAMWKTDGTAAGTAVVKSFDLGPGGLEMEFVADLNGTLLFAAADPVHGYELWKIPSPHTIEASAGVHGTISPDGAIIVENGDTQVITITPDANFCISDVIVDNVSQGKINTFTFNNVTAGHTISATFAPSITVYTDADNDLFGNPLSSFTACAIEAGLVMDNTDCNDANASIHPGAPDMCNTVDDNCNGLTDENALTATISPAGTVEVCKGTEVVFTANTGTNYSYQWKKDGAIISNATASSYITAAKGDYTVDMGNGFSCNATSPVTILKTLSKPDAVITPLGNLDICATGSVILQTNAGNNFSYQWKKNGSKITGATNQQFTATVAAGYKVVVTKANGCTKTSPETLVTKSCKLSDEKENINALSVYPNPSGGRFMIRLEGKGDETATIEVMNAIGQQMMMEKVTVINGGLLKEISFTKETPAGVYLIRVITTHRTYSSQIVLQR